MAPIALLATQFGIPVALKNIAWKTYIVFCCWCFIQSAVLYLIVPETKNRTVSSSTVTIKLEVLTLMMMDSWRSSTISSLPRVLCGNQGRRRSLKSIRRTILYMWVLQKAHKTMEDSPVRMADSSRDMIALEEQVECQCTVTD
jgi:hypothetical protein